MGQTDGTEAVTQSAPAQGGLFVLTLTVHSLVIPPLLMPVIENGQFKRVPQFADLDPVSPPEPYLRVVAYDGGGKEPTAVYRERTLQDAVETDKFEYVVDPKKYASDFTYNCHGFSFGAVNVRLNDGRTINASILGVQYVNMLLIDNP